MRSSDRMGILVLSSLQDVSVWSDKFQRRTHFKWGMILVSSKTVPDPSAFLEQTGFSNG